MPTSSWAWESLMIMPTSADLRGHGTLTELNGPQESRRLTGPRPEPLLPNWRR